MNKNDFQKLGRKTYPYRKILDNNACWTILISFMTLTQNVHRTYAPQKQTLYRSIEIKQKNI